jgi:hypothetical protein
MRRIFAFNADVLIFSIFIFTDETSMVPVGSDSVQIDVG